MPKKRTRKQVGKYSRTKGAGFERRVVKEFDKYGIIAHRTHFQPFCAHPLPDITIDTFPDLFIECKKQEHWTLEHYFATGKGKVADWWEQVSKKAKKEKKNPILVFCRNRSPILVMRSLS